MIFGGDTLVTTDVAVASGRVELGNKANVSHLSDATIQEVMGVIQEKVEAAVDSIKVCNTSMCFLSRMYQQISAYLLLLY